MTSTRGNAPGRYWEREDVLRVLNAIPDEMQAVGFDQVVELAPGVAHVRFRTEVALGVLPCCP
ncbi:hypothetical protein [Streptomyces sp. NPDC057460]|uniref:hypothetical protein n=1 Tax=Streptomyces sp. NPDC057460 TaxID=3346141 RepID=UPI0036B61B72